MTKLQKNVPFTGFILPIKDITASQFNLLDSTYRGSCGSYAAYLYPDFVYPAYVGIDWMFASHALTHLYAELKMGKKIRRYNSAIICTYNNDSVHMKNLENYKRACELIVKKKIITQTIWWNNGF